MEQASHLTKKRIIGSAFFGLIVGLYLQKALAYTIPTVISLIEHSSRADALDIYASSSLLKLFVVTAYPLIGAGVGAYLAKRRGVLMGLLTNSLIIAGLLFLLVTAIVNQDGDLVGFGMSYQLYLFIALVLVILSSIFGGLAGEALYSPENDFDRGNDKLTIFGIRWPHYFWVLPLIVYPFLSSFLIVVYSFVLLTLSYGYIGIHPSLWYNLFSFIYILIVPAGIYISGLITLSAFTKCWELLRYKQTISKGWKRFGQVVLYGIIAPAGSFFLASWMASIIHGLPTPSSGDWKINLWILAGFVALMALMGIYAWVKEKFTNRAPLSY